MRRLPIYFLVDVSESMVGEPIQQVQDSMKQIVQDLSMDPYALETVYVSVITFSNELELITGFTSIYEYKHPTITTKKGKASLDSALNFVMDNIDKFIVRTTAEVKGDWMPIVFLFTNKQSFDISSSTLTRWKQKNKIYKRTRIVTFLTEDCKDVDCAKSISSAIFTKNSEVKQTIETSIYHPGLRMRCKIATNGIKIKFCLLWWTDYDPICVSGNNSIELPPPPTDVEIII